MFGERVLAVGEEGKGGLLRVIYIPLDFVSTTRLQAIL